MHNGIPILLGTDYRETFPDLNHSSTGNTIITRTNEFAYVSLSSVQVCPRMIPQMIMRLTIFFVWPSYSETHTVLVTGQFQHIDMGSLYHAEISTPALLNNVMHSFPNINSFRLFSFFFYHWNDDLIIDTNSNSIDPWHIWTAHQSWR